MIFTFCFIMKQYDVQENVPISPYNRFLKFYMHNHKTTQLQSFCVLVFQLLAVRSMTRDEFLEKFKKNIEEYINAVMYLKIFGLVYCLFLILFFSNKINQTLNLTKIQIQTYS